VGYFHSHLCEMEHGTRKREPHGTANNPRVSTGPLEGQEKHGTHFETNISSRTLCTLFFQLVGVRPAPRVAASTAACSRTTCSTTKVSHHQETRKSSRRHSCQPLKMNVRTKIILRDPGSLKTQPTNTTFLSQLPTQGRLRERPRVQQQSVAPRRWQS
jgi:hypothetical protein